MRPNKKKVYFGNGKGSKNVRYGRHRYFLMIFFSGKNINLCILKGNSPFKMHKIIFFLQKT